MPEENEVVTIGDREADIYDLFVKPRRERCALSRPASLTHLLIRGTHNRRVNHEAEYLHNAIRQTPIVGELTIEVPRSDDRPARQATLTLRFTTLQVQPPRHHLKRATLEPVTILATYSIVGWRLLWLTYQARYRPDIGCDTVLQTHEWQALYCTIHSQPIPPDKPPSLRQAVGRSGTCLPRISTDSRSSG